MLTLIEQAEKAFDQEQSQAAAAKLMAGKGEFGLDDFLGLMRQMRRMGPMSKIMGMLPGVGQMKDQIENIDEREIDRIEAIICAMTPAERADVSILNGSRRARIANGSGVEVRDVNNLVNRFVDARKMMSQMGQMMGPDAGRMMGSMAKRASKQSKKKQKNRKALVIPPSVLLRLVKLQRNRSGAAVRRSGCRASSNPVRKICRRQ